MLEVLLLKGKVLETHTYVCTSTILVNVLPSSTYILQSAKNILRIF